VARILYKPVGLFVSVLGGMIDRADARGFASVTGAWPGQTED